MPDPNPTNAAENPFALLDLPLRYHIDEDQLERIWLKRSATLHPDRVGDDPEAASSLARINRARATLADPEARANALLVALGGPAKEQDKSLPDGFLLEMFEVREEHASGDAESRVRIESWASERRAEHERRVGEMFDALDDPPATEALGAIRLELNAWRYIERMLSDPVLD